MLRRVVVLVAVIGLAGAAWGADRAKPISTRKPDESLVKVLRTTNKAQTNRFVCEALPFKNINPFNVVNFLWAPVSREEGGIFSYAHPTEEKGYLVVICPEKQLESLRQLAAYLDKPKLTSAPGSKYIYYRMKHRNVLDAAFRVVSSYYLGRTGILWPDVETNSALIFDAPAGSDAMEEAFKEILDKPLRQVEMEVKVYEVFVNNDLTMGLDYAAWKNGPGKLVAQWHANGAYFRADNLGGSHSNQRSSGIYVDYPSAFFDFLVAKGKAKSVVNTKITAVNRVPAVVTSGDQVLYYEVVNPPQLRELNPKTVPAAVGSLPFPTNQDVVSGGDPRSPFQASDPSFPLSQAPQDRRPISSVVDAVDTGISFTVVPTIGDNMTNMNMELKVIALTGYDGLGKPLLSSTQMRDSISVANGDEVIYGGLARERHVQTTRKMPFFGSLPVVGYLLGGEVSMLQKSVIVTAVTPRLVEGSDNVTEDDEKTARKASGEEVIVLPPTELCFGQSMPYVH